jgi:hypothetical protein
MSGLKYLLDTNILIGLFTDNAEIITFLQRKNLILEECGISVISRIELLSYPQLSEKETNIILEKLAPIKPVPFDEKIEKETITLRKKLKLKIPDAIILATAITNNLELITLDKELLKKASLNN